MFLSKPEALVVVAFVIHMIGAVSSSSDHLALLDIRAKITHDPQGALTSWNDSLPFCRWRGVTCGRRHQRVTMLNLQNSGLVGTLSPYIGNLSFLGYIYLDDNQLHGSIPPEISRLYRLQVLSLSRNSFSGEILANMSSWPKLSSINLQHNELSGKIPNSFSSKSVITFLGLAFNYNLTGGIPPSLGNLTSLEQLSLAFCNLGGSIPDSFIQLKNLRRIGLADNSLVGAFPSFMFNLSKLEILSITKNQLQGSLPSNLCLSQPHLMQMEFGMNHLHGFLPPSISNCSELKSLEVTRNDLKGEIAIDFGRLQRLETLALGGNSFGSNDLDDMNFFSSLSNCSNLEAIQLSDNQLSGVLPHSLGDFSSKLSYLLLEANYLTGELPSGLSSCVSLQTLNLFGNFFYGSMPESFSSLKGLEYVNLSRNNFSGNIPTYLQQIPLKHLDLSYNNFEGEVPDKGVFANTSAISIIGNTRVCGGIPNLHLPKCTSTTSILRRRTQKLSVRPSNILLDADMVAHVGDFGLAKIISLKEGSNANTSSSSIIRGTIGYAPPEYGLGNEVSTSGDIYSYGILLLEMLTGKKPIDPMFEGGLSLHSYARSALADGCVLHIVDPVFLSGDVNENSIISLVKIGVQCSYESPQDRIDIVTVVHDLLGTTFVTRS
ncbi:hypothetical protein M8C21_023620 [Ambrosia artemisiifolia]|uniref:Protein kinase domain-containing protein n=1 Tax=Ambrosia artemisiifolia TaxID=4212 RepID=A0AAD5CZH7_AMBAR|nr:hypothetical protein M8C21_023620 [Ambrosia artemisiifolia]